jgi:hypothetical protein
MRGDLVCVRLAGSDTGRSAGLDCLTVSGSVRRRLRRLSLRKSLGFPASWGAPDVLQKCLPHRSREARSGRSPGTPAAKPRCASGRSRRRDGVSGPGSAGGCHRRCRGSGGPRRPAGHHASWHGRPWSSAASPPRPSRASATCRSAQHSAAEPEPELISPAHGHDLTAPRSAEVVAGDAGAAAPGGGARAGRRAVLVRSRSACCTAGGCAARLPDRYCAGRKA